MVLTVLLVGTAGADDAAIGRIRSSRACVYQQRDPLSSPLRVMTAGDTLRVRAGVDGWCEVLLPEGETGWIPAQHLSGASRFTGQSRGSERLVLGALAGTLAGGVVTGACVMAALTPDFFSLKLVRGSGGVSGTHRALALAAGTAASLLTPVAAGYGASAAAERVRPGGNIWWSCAGAAVGGLCGTAAGMGLTAFAADETGMAAGIGMLLGTVGTTVGAVVGYDMSRRSGLASGLAQRFDPPAIGFYPVRPDSGPTEVALKLDLPAFRF